MSMSVTVLVLVVLVCGVTLFWLRPEHDHGGQAPDDVQADDGSIPGRPPDPRRPWTAGIEWRRTDADARFVVVCRSPAARGAPATVAESEPLTWPPTGREAVQAMTTAAEELEATMVGAGWTLLRPGDAWYAKRFAWEPESAAPSASAPEPVPAAVAVAASPPEEHAPAPALLAPAPAWPVHVDGHPRCEIRWEAGWSESHFEAVAYGPEDRRGTPIAASSELRWLFMGGPDPREPAHREALFGIACELEAAGW